MALPGINCFGQVLIRSDGKDLTTGAEPKWYTRLDMVC
jgi:hypothetical protein